MSGDSTHRGASAPSLVGRAAELEIVDRVLDDTAQGSGHTLLLSGEAGIGKTHLLDEIGTRARRCGLLVLRGSCEDDDAALSYGPFRTALDAYVVEAAEATLRAQLGEHAAVIAKLATSVRRRLRDVAEPPEVPPGEERTRLLDAVSEFLIAVAARTPLALVIDDLHWADDDTLALVRHLGRTLAKHRVLVVAAYREDEVVDEGPLAQVLAVLRREFGCERVALAGLAEAEVGELLQWLADDRSSTWSPGPVDAEISRTIAQDTKGNPFFVRSLVLHLEEEGQLRIEEGRWRTTTTLEDVALPDGIRQLLQRRIKRLGQEAQAFLAVAAVGGSSFRFDVVAKACDQDEEKALAAVDSALLAQLIKPAQELDSYRFAHGLVRQTLYQALNPSRQVRLHRRVAEALEAIFGEQPDRAADIAFHYYRSRTLPNAQRGVAYCIQAADQAIARIAYAEAARHLGAAVEMLPPGAEQRLKIQARHGLTLIGSLRLEEGAQVAQEAARQMALEGAPDGAAKYLADVVRALWVVGGVTHVAALARQGLEYCGARDETWVTFKIFDIREREVAETRGIPLDTKERREVAEVIAGATGAIREMFYFRRLTTRAAILEADADAARHFPVGDYRGGIRLVRASLGRPEHQGRIGLSVSGWAGVSRWHVALGEFEAANQARQKAFEFAKRAPEPSIHTAQLLAAEDEWRLARDEDWEAPMPSFGAAGGPGSEDAASWYRIGTVASIARTLAHLGRFEKAIARLAPVVAALEQAPGWAENYTRIACDATATLWLARSSAGIDILEASVRTKVVEPDFRYPMMDGRLSLGRLCALQKRCDEAHDWFAQARSVLDEQGARPLRAVTDYDEALMLYRRGDAGDVRRARPLLDAALARFREIGMPGWIRRAECLLDTGREWREMPPEVSQPSTSSARGTAQASRPEGVFVKEGEFWRIQFGGREVRMKDARGLRFLSRLLAHPGRDIASTELVAGNDARDNGDAGLSLRAGLGDAGEVLDHTARSAYRQRLAELRAEIEEAEEFNDFGRLESLRHEQTQLAAELTRAVGLGGRSRRAGSHSERARVNVTRAIALVLRKLDEEHPVLGAYFARTIRTGTLCTYAPDPLAPVDWKTS